MIQACSRCSTCSKVFQAAKKCSTCSKVCRLCHCSGGTPCIAFQKVVFPTFGLPVLRTFLIFCYFCRQNLQTMSELIKKQVTDARAHMDKAIDHCDGELQKIRAGKASPAMLDDIVVEYYGTPTPLSQVSSVNTPDARTIVVQPWEKSLLGPIEKAIMEANLGVNPQNDGIIIR